MNKELGGGFSTSTLENCRKFYLTYQDRISQPVVREFETQKSQPLVTKLKEEAPFKLSWSHYLILMRIKDENEMYLPDKKELQEKLKEWIEELDNSDW